MAAIEAAGLGEGWTEDVAGQGPTYCFHSPLANAGARLLLAPDWPTVSWAAAERARGQVWGLKTIESFHTHGTPEPGETAG